MGRIEKKTNYIHSSKRPPVVAVLGHVDHGKTTLLDYIRKTKLATRETGGITQKIGAYQIDKPYKITFIDTPGHEAFAKMRGRGAKLADIAVLVVAGDDSVKPQTKESVEFIKKEEIPFIVALNKMDLSRSDSEKVKKDLIKIGVSCEEYGGKIVSVEISAKTGKGIEELLEMINIVSQMKIDLVADKNAQFKGVVIESTLDKTKGPVSTIIVKNGTLKIKDKIYAGDISGKVRALLDEYGEPKALAFPSEPVVVLGLPAVTKPGTKITKQRKEERGKRKEETIKQVFSEVEKKLKLIVKAGSNGELESVLDNLPKESQIVSAQVGETINSSDVDFASATGAAIIGFNVQAFSSVKKKAQQERVVLRLYNLIYKLIEEIDDVIAELTKKPKEIVVGRAKVLAKFNIGRVPVAGVRIEEGKIKINDKIKIDKNKEVQRGKVMSIKQNKLELKEALKGGEYGIGLSKDIDFKIGDVIISYNIT